MGVLERITSVRKPWDLGQVYKAYRSGGLSLKNRGRSSTVLSCTWAPNNQTAG